MNSSISKKKKLKLCKDIESIKNHVYIKKIHNYVKKLNLIEKHGDGRVEFDIEKMNEKDILNLEEIIKEYNKTRKKIIKNFHEDNNENNNKTKMSKNELYIRNKINKVDQIKSMDYEESLFYKHSINSEEISLNTTED